jgi:hypothetical protein
MGSVATGLRHPSCGPSPMTRRAELRCHEPVVARMILPTSTAWHVRVVLFSLLAALAPASAAWADPGAVDSAFGSGKGYVGVGKGYLAIDGPAGIGKDQPERVWPLADGALAWTDGFRSLVGRVSSTGRVLPGFRPRSSLTRSAPTLLGVLADGRFVTIEDRGSPTLVRRHRSGKPDATFGAGRGVWFPSEPYALAQDGRVAVVASPASVGKDETTLSLIGVDGRPDRTFAPFFDPDDRATALGFDVAGRLLMGSVSVPRQGLVRRFLADGSPDPGFTEIDTGVRPDVFTTGPVDGPIVVGSRSYNIPRRTLLDHAGRPVALPAGVADLLSQANAVAIDRQGRVLIVAGAVLLRLSLAPVDVEVLRANLPGLGPFGGHVLDMAVDRQGRIIIAGYRLLNPNSDPSECWFSYCRDDLLADTTGLLIRLEGGDRRVAILNRRRGTTVRVACLVAARRRCAGSLTLRVGHRTVRRAVRLATGADRRVRVPRALRRTAGTLVATVRIHDGTGELATAAARLPPAPM